MIPHLIPPFKGIRRSLSYSQSTSNEENDLYLIIRGVSLLIHYQICTDIEQNKIRPEKSVFSEENYFRDYNKKRIDLLMQAPSETTVSRLVEALYYGIQCSQECLVISLIYIYQIIKKTNLKMTELS